MFSLGQSLTLGSFAVFLKSTFLRAASCCFAEPLQLCINSRIIMKCFEITAYRSFDWPCKQILGECLWEG